MADAVAEKTKIKDDEFDIHGDLAVSEAQDKSFVVLYDSAQHSKSEAPKEQGNIHIDAPSLEDLDESHAMAPAAAVHPEDAYIDDILSSDDIDLPPVSPEPVAAHSDHEDDGPISLSSEELDGILEMGPGTEEAFHPDFPVDTHAAPEADDILHQPSRPQVKPWSNTDTAMHDDDELPIALSDEDLDEILLEEEGAPIGSKPASAPAAPRAASPALAPSPFDDAQEDEEPIALSDDELDNILADAEAGHSESHTAPAISNEDEVLTFDEDPQITLIDDGAPSSEHSAPAADSTSFFDSEEDEPITLSDEELDGILSSAPEEEAPKHTDEVALGELPNDGVVDVEDEEPVALSHEELDGILMDADEPHEGLAELPPGDASGSDDNKSFFDSDDDEPIALSADELDGIAATATPEDMDVPGTASPRMDESGSEDAPEAGLAELPPEEQALDERYADVDHMDQGDDDGPIALSSDELDGIVADAREVTPEAPMVGLSPHDMGGDEPSLAENTDKPATVFEEDLEAATLIHEDDKAAAGAVTPDTQELKSVMTYLDNLLGELPDDVIEKFAQSEYFKLYQKIMDKLGL